MSLPSIKDFDLNNKTLFIRSDFNIPIQNGIIKSTKRIDLSIPTIEYALRHGAKVILASHLGRPIEGSFDKEYSLKPIVDYLAKKLEIPIELVHNFQQIDLTTLKKNIYVLENVRFNVGEKLCEDSLSKKYGDLADIFVMDAFGTSHRKEASTFGVGKYVKDKCAGLLFYNEVEALTKALKDPSRPLVAIVGGSKVSSKLSVLNNLTKVVDGLILGGGILNTFIAAQGKNIGKSLYEKKFLNEARSIMDEMKKNNTFFPDIIDVVCAKDLSINAEAFTREISDIQDDDMILDLGPETLEIISSYLKKTKTILWNGPLGVFEYDQFSLGTKKLANIIASSNSYSLAGGGDTIAAIEKFNLSKNISYISTAGGAFLEFIEGKNLPAIEILSR